MKNSMRTLLLLSVLLIGQITYAQTNEEKAYQKGVKAIELMDNGNYDESIVLLNEAKKLAPDDINYPYELCMAYYLKKDYKKAIKGLEGLLKHKDVNDNVYQLLGNSYDYLGKSDKAIKTYETGLKSFPNSGRLFLEMGVMQMGKKDYNEALSYFEKGIEMAPEFSSNYYWAGKIYLSSTEEVWGMIYGEIFMNLERNSKRTSEMSKLLFDTYKQEIKFTSDTSFSVSFSQNATININDLSDIEKFKLPFGVGIYEPTLMFSILSSQEINLNTLDTIRSNFVDNYFANGHDKTYPNVLFSYQQKVKEAGQMEAYNHWILMMGDENGFEKWQVNYKEKWDNFVNWFTENQIEVDNNNKFFRGQY